MWYPSRTVLCRSVSLPDPALTQGDASAGEEQHVPQPPPEGGKRLQMDQIHVDREEIIVLDRSGLPADALDKGFEEEVVQEVVLYTDTTRFLKQTWYSKTTGQTYHAELPLGYTGQFGPQLKALTLALYFQGQMSEGKILDFYRSIGVIISAEQLSNMLARVQASTLAKQDTTYRANPDL